MGQIDLFYAAGLFQVGCQFGREFFRFAWLLSDKNLNALKTSRYKTFPSRLAMAMAWRLNLFTSLLIRKKISLPEPGIEPGTSWSRVSRSTNWATYPFVIWEWKLVVYILQCCFWIKVGYNFLWQCTVGQNTKKLPEINEYQSNIQIGFEIVLR